MIDAKQPVPWRAFLRNPPLRALGYTHFCNNWCVGGQSSCLTNVPVVLAGCLPACVLGCLEGKEKQTAAGATEVAL